MSPQEPQEAHAGLADLQEDQVRTKVRNAMAAAFPKPLVRQRRGQARGNMVEDWDREPVLLRRSGRERGGVVYLSEETLRRAWTAAGVDPAPAPEDVEVFRAVLGGHKGEAQVLLKIRVRKGAHR